MSTAADRAGLGHVARTRRRGRRRCARGGDRGDPGIGPPVPLDDREWFPAIEALRGIAAAAVVVDHTWALSGGAATFGFGIVQGLGTWGVNIFFLLSGYLLADFFWVNRGNKTTLEFYLRRFFRIAPAYYVCIGILYLFFAQHSQVFSMQGLHQVLANVTFTQHLFPGTESNLNVDGALWTLSIEMTLYLFLPLLAFLIAWRPVLASLGLAAIGIAWRIYIARDGAGITHWYFGKNSLAYPPYQYLFLSRQFIGLLPIFVLGMAVRWAVLHGYLDRIVRSGSRHPSLAVLFLLLAPSLLFLKETGRVVFYDHWIWFTFFDYVLCLLALPALLYASRPVRQAPGPAARRRLAGRTELRAVPLALPGDPQRLRHRVRGAGAGHQPPDREDRPDLGDLDRPGLGSFSLVERPGRIFGRRLGHQLTHAAAASRRVGIAPRRNLMTTQARSGPSARIGHLGARVAAALGGTAAVRPTATVPDPLPADEYELIAVDAGHLWMSRRDEVMRPYMLRTGTWEREEGALLLSLVTPGCRFLDIGANVGYFSVLVGSAAPGVTVDSVEPNPDNVRALRFNLWSNRVDATVWPRGARQSRPLPRAVRERPQSRRPAQLPDHRSSGSERDRAVEPIGEAGGTGGWVVPAAAGDDLFPGRGFDLVKIDVQGWEFEVILGLDAVLLRSPGVRIVTEFWPAPVRANDREPADVIARYRQLGYRVRVSQGDDLVELSDEEIVAVCDSGGPDGQVNLLLER